MKNEVEYLIDLKKLDRFESIAFQKAYDKVKKDVRVFEAELRSKIATEIKKEEVDKIKKQLEKNITVRLEKHYQEIHDKKMIELEKLIQENKFEKEYLDGQLNYIRNNVRKKYSKFPQYKHKVIEALEYKLENPQVTIRELHKRFVPEISLSTFYEYTKKVEIVKS